MRISLFVKKGGWHANQLKQEAKNKKVQLDIVKLNDLNNLQKKIDDLGDVIIWNSIPKSTVEKRTLFFNLIKDKPAINPAYQKYPFVMRKVFQQRFIEKHTSLNHIPTFVFKDKKELKKSVPKYLRFPIIRKPDFGSQGDDITILKSLSDIKALKIDFEKYLFQGFIRNFGDYRVLVLGGKVLGIIKRTAKEGSFLNNVSKGGAAEKISDPKLSEILSKIALTVASVFNLSFCGIDIIFNEDDGKYYFLELNANPQWRGFQAATGINVASEIIDFCIALGDRGKKSTPQLVEDYYEKNYESLGEHQFHYASRMYLWTRKRSCRKKLDALKSFYLDTFEKNEPANILRKFRQKKNEWEGLIAIEKRGKYLKKYPNLVPYNRVLFKSLFAESIYKEDLRPLINRVIEKKDFLDLANRLKKDEKAVAALSTSAVNFFYNLSHYLKDPNLARPSYFFDIFKNNYSGEMEKCNDLRIYLITHSIIGESQFYSRGITRSPAYYLEMLKAVEKLITDNYFSLSLDVKSEFLVCCRLCNYYSGIEELIKNEAERSLAEIGNFLVSKLSDSPGFISRNLQDAEHRNVLYLMACKPSKLFRK